MAVSTIKAEFQCEIEKVWELVTSLDKYSWRSDLDKIVVTVPEKEFEEHTKDGYVTKFKITAFNEYKNYEFDSELPERKPKKKKVAQVLDNIK